MSDLTLFPADPVAVEAARLPMPDLFTIVARRKLGTTDEWHVFRWTRVGNTNDAVVEGSLCVGRDTPQRRWHGAKSKCVVTYAEAEDARVEWERETGLCGKCGGNKTRWAGWSKAEGSRYRDCERCNATGAAPEAPHA